MIIKKVGQKIANTHTKEEISEVTLPSERSHPSTRMGDYSWLIYGEKKIGKTSLAAQFEGAFFLMFEPGGKALSIYQRPVHSWAEFKKYTSLITKNKGFQTIVIDTVDIAYQMCTEYVCKKLVIDHLSDEDWGKGYAAARNEFTLEIGKLLKTGKGVIFISHAVEKEIRTRTGEKYHKIVPTMSGQARDILEGIVDIWAYYNYHVHERILIIEGDDHVGAGHRVEKQFRYIDGSSIKFISMGVSPHEAYINLTQAFENKLRKGGNISTSKKLVIKKKPH